MLRMSAPKVQVEFFGYDRSKSEPWVHCLKDLGAQVDFKLLIAPQNIKEDELPAHTDIAVFTAEGDFLRTKKFAAICSALKESGIFVVVIYQTAKQVTEMKSSGVQPNWILPGECTAQARMHFSSDILETVRFIKWSNNLEFES